MHCIFMHPNNGMLPKLRILNVCADENARDCTEDLYTPVNKSALTADSVSEKALAAAGSGSVSAAHRT